SRTLWGNKGISHGVGGTALGRIWNRISDTEAVPTGDPAKTIGITIKDAAVRSRATRIEVPDGNVLFPEQEGLAGSILDVGQSDLPGPAREGRHRQAGVSGSRRAFTGRHRQKLIHRDDDGPLCVARSGIAGDI